MPLLFKGAGLALKPILPYISPITKAISIAAPTFYVGSIGARVALAPSPEKRGEVFGGIVTTEIAPMVAGGYLGSQFWSRVGTWVKPGGEKLVKEDIFSKEYLAQMKAGKVKIPTAPVKNT